MSETVKPALSADEWNEWNEGGLSTVAQKTRVGIFGQRRIQINLTPVDPDESRALAAVLLYGLPEGFTREDVQHLRDVGRLVMAKVNVGGVFGYDWCNSIADRIEALLPPPEKK